MDSYQSVPSKCVIIVSQGPTLRLILFNIFNNDVFDNCNKHPILFANDTSEIMKSINTQILIHKYK